MSLTPTAANPESAKQGLESMAQNLALFRDIMGGNVTEASIPQGMKDALSGIAGAFVGEEVIQQQLAENFPTIQGQIIAKLTDPNVAAKDNMLVQVINKMEPEQLDQMLADSPELKGFIEDTLAAGRANATVTDLVQKTGLELEGLGQIQDKKLSELTPADIATIPDANLKALVISLPYEGAPEEGASPTGFGVVLDGLNTALTERGLSAITLDAGATAEQKAQAFDTAIDQITQYETENLSITSQPGAWLSSLFTDVSDNVKAEVTRNVFNEIHQQAPAAISSMIEGLEVNGATIKQIAQESPEAIASALRAPENADKLKDVITLQLLQNNAAELLPFAGDLMQGQALGGLTGFLNNLSEQFPALGQFMETFNSMMTQVTDKLGLGNMFADLGGSEGPQQGSALRNHYGEAIDTRINVDAVPTDTANINGPPTANVNGPPSEQRYAATGTGGPSM